MDTKVGNAFMKGQVKGFEHAKPSRDTLALISKVDEKVDAQAVKFDEHLKVYAENGKELARVGTNQEWLMRFFWIFMTPIVGGIGTLLYMMTNYQI